MSTSQRATMGATWGGSDWGIHVSSDVNYTLGEDNMTWEIHEAYASTDLMGYASLTAGRQALSYGSGALMSTRDWGTDRTTWDGMTFGLNLDAADVTIGYANKNAGLTEDDEDTGQMWMNAGGNFSGWDVNFLYIRNTIDGEQGDAATGIDISGEVSGAGVSASMNTDFGGNEMRVLGLTYAVNDDMGVNVSQTTYGDDEGFNMRGTDADNTDGVGYANGQMTNLSANDEMLSYGLTYNMNGITLGATIHNVTNDDVDDDRKVTEVSLGYSLNANSSLSLKRVSDDDDKYMWITLNVGL